jgi:hypothetical protein
MQWTAVNFEYNGWGKSENPGTSHRLTQWCPGLQSNHFLLKADLQINTYALLLAT